jgi:hypothetical protein
MLEPLHAHSCKLNSAGPSAPVLKVPEDTLDFLQPLAGLHWLNLYGLPQQCNFQVAQANCVHVLSECMQTSITAWCSSVDRRPGNSSYDVLMLVMPAGSDSSAAVDMAFNRNGRGM